MSSPGKGELVQRDASQDTSSDSLHDTSHGKSQGTSRRSNDPKTIHVVHGFEPVFDESSRVLVLGSFPSVKSRDAGFYYGNPRNRFWSVMSAVTGTPITSDAGIDDKLRFLLDSRIALWDVVKSCDIVGSSDTSIRNAVANNIAGLLARTSIVMVFCNGATAWNLYGKLVEPSTGLPAVKLPSTSPANAAWSLDRLVSAWQDTWNRLQT